MADAMKRQAERAKASMAVDRKGWTTDQWCEDADRLMNEEDGAVTSLLNGHVLALLRVHREWQALKWAMGPPESGRGWN